MQEQSEPPGFPTYKELENLLSYTAMLPKLNPDSEKRQTIPPEERAQTVRNLLESERYKPLQCYMEAYIGYYRGKKKNLGYIKKFQQILEALSDYILFYEPNASRRMGLMSDETQKAKYKVESQMPCFFIGTEPEKEGEYRYEMARCQRDFAYAIQLGVFDDGELASADFGMDFLESLEETDREIFSLRFGDRLGQEEIAERLGIGRQALRTRLGRIKKKYREYYRRLNGLTFVNKNDT